MVLDILTRSEGLMPIFVALGLIGAILELCVTIGFTYVMFTTLTSWLKSKSAALVRIAPFAAVFSISLYFIFQSSDMYAAIATFLGITIGITLGTAVVYLYYFFKEKRK